MELFKIICETCAARLKVSHPSAIGQVLACPKCGNMVRIEPPDDWQMPDDIRQQLEAQQAADAASKDTNSSDFDDVHHVLASSSPVTKPKRPTTGGRGPQTGQPRSSKTQPGRATTPPQKPKKTAAAAIASPHNVASDKVLLPNEQWTAASARKRRQILLVVSAALGLLLIGSAIVVAVIANWPTTSDTVASTPPAPAAFDAAQPDYTETESSDTANVGNNVESKTHQEVKTDDKGPGTVDLPELENNPAEDTTATTETPLDDHPAEPENTVVPPSTSDISVTDVTTGKPDTVASGAPNLPDLSPKTNFQLDEILDPKSPQPLEKTAFGTISDLLEESGTSITEIHDLAAEYREQQLIGQSKYFVEKPDPLDPRVFEGLNYPCEGIQYVDKSLIVVLHDISQISGVPISLDANSIRFLGIDIGKNVSIKSTETTFASIVNVIVAADDFGLALEYDDTHDALLIARELLHGTGNSSVQVVLPNLESKDRAAVDQFVSLVKGMIAPEIWTAENDPGTIDIQGDHLEVTAPPLVGKRIQAFVEKWNAGKMIAGGNEDSSGALTTLLTKAQPMMDSSFQIDAMYPVPLETYLAKIHLQTGKNVIVDWPSLLAEGWNPQTMLPPDIVEKSLRDFLRQICRAMELTYRVIDEKTVQITTFSTAARETDFEVYSCAKILDRLTHEQLVQLLQQALGLEIQSQPNLRIFLDAESKSLFVIAPQFIHRQINAILDRLQ